MFGFNNQKKAKSGLKMTNRGGWLKTVSTNAKSLIGVTHGVELCLGLWKGRAGRLDFSVASMDGAWDGASMKGADATVLCYNRHGSWRRVSHAWYWLFSEPSNQDVHNAGKFNIRRYNLGV